MYIITNKQDGKILEIQDSLEIIEEKWVKSLSGSLMQLDFVGIYEVEIVPDNANYYKDGVFYTRHPDDVNQDKESIQKQLDELDKKSIRDAEDLFDVLVKKGIISESDVAFLKERKDKKKALRKELKELV